VANGGKSTAGAAFCVTLVALIVEGQRLHREDGPPVVVVAALLRCCLRGGILAVTRKLAKQYKIQ
jgi:hypothetical protein